MKKLSTLLLVLLTLLCTQSATVTAAANKAGNASVSSNHQREEMVKRVYEIRDMNFATLSEDQKETLRTELLLMKNKMSDPDFTGLYLSSGVIIIILIVLLVLALGKD